MAIPLLSLPRCSSLFRLLCFAGTMPTEPQCQLGILPNFGGTWLRRPILDAPPQVSRPRLFGGNVLVPMGVSGMRTEPSGTGSGTGRDDGCSDEMRPLTLVYLF